MLKIILYILTFQIFLYSSNVKLEAFEREFSIKTDFFEEIKKISFPKNTDNILKNEPIRNITLYEQLIIEVDSSKNLMFIKGKLNNKINTLLVTTALVLTRPTSRAPPEV